MASSTNEQVLESLIQAKNLECSLELENKSFALNDVSIIKSQTPVNRPTMRGGVYFSDSHVYKIKGNVDDTSIIPLLSKTMLGPNTEFGEIIVKTHSDDGMEISFYTNLTNSMQSSSKVEVNLTIVRMEKN